jgi:wyosine [tRNA(Phe)-imidazoG37] synthetase (radical SAM superfamily)
LIVFGPVPSRRLGRSLGINNIPAKVCSYSCVYCQLGNTVKMQIDRQSFYEPELIYEMVKKHIEKVKNQRGKIDYLTFVPDGEPTLDINLGKEINLLKTLGIKVAVITNASLMYKKDVRKDLTKVDLLSCKIDTVIEKTWRKMNRPCGPLHLTKILEGILEFSERDKNEIITETMILDGVNDNEKEVRKVATFLGQLNPMKAFISIPTRPPAEQWVTPAKEQAINMTYHIFSKILGEDNVEYLIEYEGSDFTYTGKVEEDLLSITLVHPMRAEAVDTMLEKAGADWSLVKKMIKEKKLVELSYDEHKFYMRKLPSRR